MPSPLMPAGMGNEEVEEEDSRRTATLPAAFVNLVRSYSLQPSLPEYTPPHLHPPQPSSPTSLRLVMPKKDYSYSYQVRMTPRRMEMSVKTLYIHISLLSEELPITARPVVMTMDHVHLYQVRIAPMMEEEVMEIINFSCSSEEEVVVVVEEEIPRRTT